MNFGHILPNSWLIMGFIMGGVEFLPNFFLGLTSQRLCWGREYMYSVHYTWRFTGGKPLPVDFFLYRLPAVNA